MENIKMLRMTDLVKKIGVGRSKIYELIKNDDFVKPIKIGNSSCWPEGEIDEWLLSKMKKRA